MRTLSPAETDVGRALGLLWRHILPAVERTFRRYDLTYLDFTVLETLRAADGRALPAGHLASVAGVTSSRLSHRLAALESQGDVLRRQAHGDGRVVEVVITDAGADRLERALPTTSQTCGASCSTS